ncbi:MAG: DUF3574 domain-containing protein [Reyranella sp.]|uniref:DUF3574 domain-containing protein n=1 Tax=Reyranella sp. TaxID=1929291 RepID=UPI003D0C42C5
MAAIAVIAIAAAGRDVLAQVGLTAACVAPLKPAVSVELYFGRGKPDGGEVSDREWEEFLAEEVSPRFPDGLSVMEVMGQYRGSSGRAVSERSKRLHIIVFDSPAHLAKIAEIIDLYRQRFRQESVLRTERSLCAAL